MSATWTLPSAGRWRLQPVEVEVAVGADLEPVAGQPGDGDVAADAAVGVEQQAVGHRPDRLVDVAGHQSLQEGRRARSGDEQPLERGHVVQGHRLAGALRLGRDDRRPVPRGPAFGLAAPRVRRPGRRWPRTSADVPSRWPRGRPRRGRPRVSRTGWCGSGAGSRPAAADAGCRRPRRSSGSRGCGTYVGRELVRLEPVHVAFVQVECRAVPVDEQLGHRAGDAGRVGHPDRLGDPEPADLGRFADQRHAVGGEGEDAVDAVDDFRRRGSPAAAPGSASRPRRSRAA